MLLKILVLVASFGQVAAAGLLSIGTFETSARAMPVFIQPASWAFSIWGVIYALSIVYAIYQVIPSKDNETLRATRLPALIGMVGSGVWIYFAGMESQLVWLTVPILFGVAYSFTLVVTAPESRSLTQNFFSKYTLLPYAAWTAIACWINLPALLVDQNIITTSGVNFGINLTLFIGIAIGTVYYFRRSNYNAFYGAVMVWAFVAVAIVNYQRESWVFTGLALLLALVTVALYARRKLA